MIDLLSMRHINYDLFLLINIFILNICDIFVFCEYIYFYQFLYEWKKINLSFYKLTHERFDVGILINTISFNCYKKSALDILLLYENNTDFIEKSISKIKKKSFFKFQKKIYGKLNVSPSWYLIFKTFLILKIIKIK